MRSNLSLKESNDTTSHSSSALGRVPPHSIESEQAVLGGVLLDNESAHSVFEVLRGDDFYKQEHKVICDAIASLYEKRDPIDIVTLASELERTNSLEKAGGVDYLSYLVDITPTAANTRYYARIVKDLSLRRRVIHQSQEIIEEAFNSRGDVDGFIDSVEQRIFKVSESRTNQSFAAISDIVKDSIKEVERRCTIDDPITGVPTGLSDLDFLTSGLQRSDLIIIAGRPSMGKTAFVLSVVRNAAMDYGHAVAVFSLEMSKEQIVTRLLCGEAKISSDKVRKGDLAEKDFPRLVDAASKLSQAKIFIDDTPAISVLEMRAKARRLHREHPLSLIVIDYLQLMRGSSRGAERREQEISEISRSVKALAKELNIPIIALSQLNRAVETRTDKRPMMADLRESGAIEQDADIIGFVYRDEVYNPDTPSKGVAELIIGKHRNGAIGTVRLAFLHEFTTFQDLADEADYDYLGADIGLAGGTGFDDEFI